MQRFYTGASALSVERRHSEALKVLWQAGCHEFLRQLVARLGLERHLDAIVTRVCDEFDRKPPLQADIDEFIAVRCRIITLKFCAAPPGRRQPAAIATLLGELEQLHSPFLPAKELDEVMLTIRAQAGDHAAFDDLWSHNEKAVRGSLVMFVSEEMAKDILHDTWVAVKSNIADFDPAIGSFRTFATSVAHNKRRQFFARQQKHHCQELVVG